MKTFSEEDPGLDGRPPRTPRPTMKEVAAVAGVSLSTVSRVVNGDPKVRGDLADKVHQATDLLGYRRDLTASTLRRADRASASLGLVLEDVANPFFSAVHRGLEDVARERGVLTFAASSDNDPGRERELAQALCARGVDGLLLAPAGDDHSYLLRDRDAGVALVFVDRPPRFLDADVVLSDNRGGAAAAVAHLATAGHRRIALLADREQVFTAAERARGYRDALAAAGIPADPALARIDLRDSDSAHQAVLDLLRDDDPPTALFTSQNLITVGAVNALRALGLQRRVALVGFDDILLGSALEPGLSVVAQDAAAIGRAAAGLLFARLDGDRGPTRRLVLPTTLIPRGSGELPPPAEGAP